MEKRENWGSRFGFIMAAAGFSIGLGNIWRFPYLTGVNGGGAFVFVYLIICLLIGIPLFTMEMSLGRKTQLNPVEGMRSLTKKGSIWVAFGWLGVLSAFVILTYYMQIMGWLLAYLFKMVSGSLSGLTAEGYTQAFTDFTSNTVLVAVSTLACVIIVALISSKGLEKGIEKACKFLMPTLFTMLIILAIRSLTLPGAMEGLKWYLRVDFSKINGQVLLAALGQCFFSIGIASGGAFIYGSYLKKDSNIPTDAIIIIGFDTLAALIAGIVIFPAIFALGLEPNAGASLLFVTMSNLFSHLPAGNIFGGMFFLLVFFAALSSALGYLEPVVMTCTELFKMDRKKAVWLSLIVIFVVGFPTIMAQGPWSDILIGGRNFFDFADYLSGNIMMPLGALVLAFYTLFVWKFEKYQEETNIGASKFKVFSWWGPLVKILIPVALVIIFITGIF
ncbi:sodium-dependent transporter [Clostridium sp. Cult2]|uniref:sodium-dependent transporter n=1 Tax=Clostridium sp. Cult2 TaxID=2079003 RepID=UPI001F2B029C|nr:sodium-dependent transporter [Clostridium sp. Cult2]MCF6465737.1 sodium-dependent transporter [Clostridium sp. Cult2]